MKFLILMLDPARQWKIVPLLMVIYYAGISFTLYSLTPSPYFFTCGAAACVSAVALYIGGSLAKKKRSLAAPDRQKPNGLLVNMAGLFFIFFVALVISTASSIPILAALSGGDAGAIAGARADFLKAREGWQGIFVYISALLAAYFFPYILVKLYYVKSRKYLLFIIIFSIYSVLSTEKAFFLKWALPLLTLFLMLGVSGSHKHLRTAMFLFTGSIILLLLNITLAGFAGSGSLLDVFKGVSISDFFNADFSSAGSKGSALAFLLWRVFAVPAFSATDSIKTFQEVFHGHLLLGATNGTLTSIFDMPRVWFEREVFAGEWGQSPSGTHSSNAAFFIEAYVNFGWLGVATFGLVAGYLLAKMGSSRDIGIRMVTPLFTLGLFTSGLLGNLLGDGLLLVLIASWFHMRGSRRSHQIHDKSGRVVLPLLPAQQGTNLAMHR